MIRKFVASIVLALSLGFAVPASADLLSSAKEMMGDDALTTSLGAGLGLDADQTAGVLTNPITDLGRLNAAMDKLGISQETAPSLYQKLGDFVGSSGSKELQNSLMSLLQ